jgi:hypothetical protein
MTMPLPIFQLLQAENRKLRKLNAEMLTALKELSDYIDTAKWGQPWAGRPHVIADKARAVIAKAEQDK